MFEFFIKNTLFFCIVFHNFKSFNSSKQKTKQQNIYYLIASDVFNEWNCLKIKTNYEN